MDKTSPVIYWLIGIILLILIIFILIELTAYITAFSRELKYLNNEIDRTTGSERRYYIRKRRKLWLSLLPFVRY